MENNFIEFTLLNGNYVKYNKNLVTEIYYNKNNQSLTIWSNNDETTYWEGEDIKNGREIYDLF